MRKKTAKNRDSRKEHVDDSGAAVVCGHVASRKHPIRYAQWDETDDPVDSGWQFVCHVVKNEDWRKAQIWSINDVLRLEPSLKKPLENQTVRAWFREDFESPWQPVDPSEAE